MTENKAEWSRAEFVTGTAQNLIPKVIFFSVTLSFTILGYSIQFNGNPTNETQIYYLISSWFCLTLSGLLGLKSAYSFTNFVTESTSMWSLKTEFDSLSVASRAREHQKYEDRFKRQSKSLNANLKHFTTTRLLHFILLISGLALYGYTRSQMLLSSIN